MTPTPSGADASHDQQHAFVDAVLAWAPTAFRDLPWRRTRDPWAVLVAECMLQQTQVARVAPKWEAFLERLPTAIACADAGVGETIRLWQGLGYNRRAVQLHAAAGAVRDRHGGIVPSDLAELLAVPGVGAYTARAIRTFAYEFDDGVLDVNVARVLARALHGAPLKSREAQALADALVPHGAGWAWNQGMLDLGATVCTKRAPSCARCPVAPLCRWAAGGFGSPDPASGTAGTSGPQSRFAGSDRQGRGRLVDHLRHGPVLRGELGEATGWPNDPARALRVAVTLVRDGLAEWSDSDRMLRMPT